MNTKIRKATQNDTRAIAQIFHDSWLITYLNKEYNILIEDISPVVKKMLSEEGLQKRSLLTNINTIVAEHEGLIVGVASFKVFVDKYYLSSIYISPSFVGKGIGTKLFNHLTNTYFLDKKPIYLSVAIYNKNAIEFYKKLGFIESGREIHPPAAVLPNGKVIPEIELLKK